MPSESAPALPRSVAVPVAALLAVAVAWVMVELYAFGQQRFFTVDEFQTGHATWLIAQGQRPYVDFYEHHFPLGYTLHAPLLDPNGDFARYALRMRDISFAYLLLLALTLAACRHAVNRDAGEALLTAIVPFAFGFSAMSLIEYRLDNFANGLFLASFALTEVNRRLRRRGVALAAAVLFAASCLMTQKMAALGCATLGIVLAVDAFRRRRGSGEPFLQFPVVFLATAGVIGVIALGVGGLWGILPDGWRVTVLEAGPHARLDKAVSVRHWWDPFFEQTRATTLAIVGCAAVWLVLDAGRDPWWLVPLGVALALRSQLVAGYPYNFVFPALIVCLLAVRGFALLARAVGRRAPGWAAVLYLLPLAVLPQQLGFLSGRSSNENQLRILSTIEAYSGPSDRVIDGAGGALFRDHGSYHWVHGTAHRALNKVYFTRDLIDDYRKSRAIFWIDDFRQRELPGTVRAWFDAHYIRVDGELFALGFTTPPSLGRPLTRTIDVVREGGYYVFPAIEPSGEEIPEGFTVGGRPAVDGVVHLTEGAHEVAIPPRTPSYRISAVPAAAFREGRARYGMLFEYDRESR